MAKAAAFSQYFCSKTPFSLEKRALGKNCHGLRQQRKPARNIRATWADYGISPQRLDELTHIARSDEYAGIVLECALKADRKSAGHIILSVVEGLSYERVEFHGKLGRCSLGRSDFYGARRLFFHYLDCALKDGEMMIQEEQHE